MAYSGLDVGKPPAARDEVVTLLKQSLSEGLWGQGSMFRFPTKGELRVGIQSPRVSWLTEMAAQIVDEEGRGLSSGYSEAWFKRWRISRRKDQ